MGESFELEFSLLRQLASVKRVESSLLKEAMTNLAGSAQSATGAAASAVLVLDEPEHPNIRSVRFVTGSGPFEATVGKLNRIVLIPDEQASLAGWVISRHRVFLSQNFEAATEPRIVRHEPSPGTNCALFPIDDSKGRVVGVLRVDLVANAALTRDHQIELERLAVVAGRCFTYFENALNGHRDESVLAWANQVISERSASEADVDSFLDVVVRVVTAATLADSCAIFLIDESMRTLTQRAGCGSQRLRKVIRSYPLPEIPALAREHEPVGLTAYIAATGDRFYAKNRHALKKHPHHRGRYDPENFEGEERCGSWYGVPLVMVGTIVGVLKIENIARGSNGDRREFGSNIRERVDSLADIVAVAIERVKEHTERRYSNIDTALNTMLTIADANLSVQKLVERVVDVTMELFDARACALFLKEGNQLIQPTWAARGWAKEGPSVRRYDLVKAEEIKDNPESDDQKVGLTVWIAAKQTKFTAKSNDELTAHPHHRGTYDKYNFSDQRKCETFMGIPLLAGNELVGVLKVETKYRKLADEEELAYFSEQDERVLELIASSVAVAIRNARIVESRVLANELLERAPDDVFQIVHDFMEGRAEVVHTLEQATEFVRYRDEAKADITHRVGLVLSEPSFRENSLSKLAEKVAEHPRAILNIFSHAMEATTVPDIEAFVRRSSSRATEVVMDSPRVVMRAGAELFDETCMKLRPYLDKYRGSAANRAALRNCVSLLTQAMTGLDTINLFESCILRHIFAMWEEAFRSELRQFQRIENRYHAGTGLESGSALFVGREDVFDWIGDRLRMPNRKLMVLRGGGRTGKTSILNQLVDADTHQLPDGVLPVYVDLHRLASTAKGETMTGEYLLGLSERFAGELRKKGVPCEHPSEVEFQGRRPFAVFDRFLDDLALVIEKSPFSMMLIMLDEFGSLDDEVQRGRIDESIFPYLRSVFQHSPKLSFLIAGKQHFDDLQPKFRDLIGALAEHRIVGVLQADSARRLIREPVAAQGVTFEDEVVDRILKVTRHHPYFIQQICSLCVDKLNESKHEYNVNIETLDEALELALAEGNTNVLQEQLATAEKEGRIILRELANLVDEQHGLAPLSALEDRLSHIDNDLLARQSRRLQAHELIVMPSSGRDKELVGFGTDLLRRMILANHDFE